MNKVNFKNKPLKERRIIVRSIIARILKAYRVGNVTALAQLLDCNVGTIKNWGCSGRLPMDPILQCHFNTGVSLSWLMQTPRVISDPNPDEVKRLAEFLASELDIAVRNQLIVEKSDNGLDILATDLSVNALKWIRLEH